VLEPIIKPKGIDDVPIVALTLHSTSPDTGAFDLERVAHSIEAELKRVPGTREVRTIGGPGRAVMVEMDPARMAGAGVTVADLRQALQSANQGLPVGELLGGNRAVAVEAGPFLQHAREVAELVVGVRGGKPVFLRDVAGCATARPASRYVWHGGSARPTAAANTRPSRSRSPRSRARTPSTWPTRDGARGAAATTP
jgi:multidrug efflux pump subunit AcrB